MLGFSLTIVSTQALTCGAKIIATVFGFAVLCLAMQSAYQGYGMRGAILVMFMVNAALALLCEGCVMLIGISLIMKVNRRDDDRE
ncbi:MAG: hypothetical protein R3C45_14165 [Phycisphaerales bacterium]